jgi:1-acyl-sn-glycerol-3-phosphate acyltransferase
MIGVLRGAATGALFATHAAAAVAQEGVMALGRFDAPRRRRLRAQLAARFARSLLRFHKFDVRVSGREHLAAAGDGCLAVANHLSMWDLPVLAIVFAPTFVSTQEVRAAPMLGCFARLCGCMFVDRRRRTALGDEIAELAAVLGEGRPVLLFPEGTSTDGGGVLPFRSVLFRAATAAGKPVLPVCIQYETLAGRQVAGHNRDRLFFFGDQRLHRQLLRVLSARDVRVAVSLLPPIFPGRDVADHKELCAEAYRQISRVYRPIPNSTS